MTYLSVRQYTVSLHAITSSPTFLETMACVSKAPTDCLNNSILVSVFPDIVLVGEACCNCLIPGDKIGLVLPDCVDSDDSEEFDCFLAIGRRNNEWIDH